MYDLKYSNVKFIEERALFSSKNVWVDNCSFSIGESPFKESNNIKVTQSVFHYKYPLWYCKNVDVDFVRLEKTARSGIWYTENISMRNSLILAPKTFRRSKGITLDHVDMPNGADSFWECEDIKLFNVRAKGDYLGMNSKNIEVDHLYLEGNYFIDGAKNITVRNSTLYSKDAFWNCENVTVINSTIIGEYIGWNSKNVTFINCVIESHQGFCYMKNVKLVNCKVINSDLTFEYSEDIDADIINVVESIKNPASGYIRCKDVKHLILEEQYVNRSKIKVIVNSHEQI